MKITIQRRAGLPWFSQSSAARAGHYMLRGLLAIGFSVAAAETNSLVGLQFDRDVRPIFQQSCFRCHGPERPRSSFRLDDRDEALKGGDDNTNDIVPGHSEQSALIRYVAGQDEKIQMPPPDRGPPLTPAQVRLLTAWIDQGALWSSNRPPEFTFSVAPTLRSIEVQGNQEKFRELEGVQEGLGGGADGFSVSEQLAPDVKFALAGHVRMPEQDIQVTMALDQKDFGFVHGGFEEWRQFYEDMGGYYPPFKPPDYSSDRDLHLDMGRLWLDFGLLLPDSGQLVFGYEYQFRQGTEALLAWGPVTQNNTTKNIYPDTENIGEGTHVVKADFSDTWWGWNLEDRTRVEVYHLSEQRNDAGSYTNGPNPSYLERVDQSVHYTEGMNTLHVEKQLTDWWLVSGGALLSELDGTTLLNQSTVNVFGAPVSGQFWQTEGITISSVSRVVSLGTLLVPFRGLSLSGGAQGEWTHEDGFGNVNLAFGDPAVPSSYFQYPGTVNANLDRTDASENFNVRLTRLPRTVLFAEARLQQESVEQSDTSDNTVEPVDQSTDALNHYYDARAGFTVSPWNWLEVGGHYRQRDSSTGYNNLIADPGNGYPGFITRRDIALEEIEGRVVVRPVSWWSARLTYDRDATKFSSAAAGVTNFNGSVITPDDSPILDGRTTADNFGLELTFTPVQRVYFSGSATYSRDRTTTAGEDNIAVVPYAGDTWTLNASAGYVLNEKTSLNVTYAFSEASYSQNNTAGLPLGLDFTRHELLAGIKRQLTKRLSGALRYEFSQYAEPSSGTVNNFTAHGIFATLSYRWP
ncbi:MAG: c-type cytochrome domain-containing protein [Verrucomicrobiota bacterium]